MRSSKTLSRLALEPDLQPLVLLERAKLFTALLRSLANIDRSEAVLKETISYAKRRFYRGPLPQNPESWLRRASLRILQDYRFANTLSFRSTDPLPLLFAISHPALTEKSRHVLALDFLFAFDKEQIAKSNLDVDDWEGQSLRARRAIQHSLIADIRSFKPRHTERINSMQVLLFNIFSIIEPIEGKHYRDYLLQYSKCLLEIPYLLQESMGLVAWMELESLLEVTNKCELRVVDRTKWSLKQLDDIEAPS